MADKLDRSLDEILGEHRAPSRNRRGGGGGGGGGGSRRRERDNYPRDGVRKNYNRDDHRNLDSEWVHDRFESHVSGRGAAPRRRSPEQSRDVTGVRIRVDNIHYDLTESELEDLFSKIAPVLKFNLRYDRAGRSEGVAFVTYETKDQALTAVKEYDGANALGQQIRLSIVADETRRGNRNPFDTAVMPGRPLSERITMPGGGRSSRSPSPTRRYEEEAARKGIDRYVPSSSTRSRSRSPRNRRRGGGGGGGSGGGRRPGARREPSGRDSGRNGGGNNGQKTGRDGRPRKTQEELDAEMADYFGGGGTGGGADNAAPAAANGGTQAAVDDVDMIE